MVCWSNTIWQLTNHNLSLWLRSQPLMLLCYGVTLLQCYIATALNNVDDIYSLIQQRLADLCVKTFLKRRRIYILGFNYNLT